MIAPGGIGDVGAHLYHFTTGSWTAVPPDAGPDAPYAEELLAIGDMHPSTSPETIP